MKVSISEHFSKRIFGYRYKKLKKKKKLFYVLYQYIPSSAPNLKKFNTIIYIRKIKITFMYDNKCADLIQYNLTYFTVLKK